MRSKPPARVQVCEVEECQRLTAIGDRCERHRKPGLGKRRSEAQELAEIRRAMAGLAVDESGRE